MYFSKKGIRSVQWGLGQGPSFWEFSRIFWYKVTLQSARLLLTVRQKKIGEARCTSCFSKFPNDFVRLNFNVNVTSQVWKD